MMEQIIVFFVISLIIFFYLMLRFYDKDKDKQKQSESESPNQVQTSEQEQQEDDIIFTETSKVVFAQIKNKKYYPKNIVIELGTTVIWTNEDTEFHSVTSLHGFELRSHLLKFREQYSHTFINPGTYIYYCTVFPSIMGTVHVLDKE